MQASVETCLSAQRAELRLEAKAEIEARVRAVEARLTPRDAITSVQCEKLQTRLASMHAAELLTEPELHKLEDLLVCLCNLIQSAVVPLLTNLVAFSQADYVELKLSVGVLTSETVHAFDAPRQVLLLIGLSESIVADVAFARQARRKFL